MREADFWSALEFRICRELQGMAARNVRAIWCDGLIPQNYHLDESEPFIDGLAWMGSDHAQSQWRFALFLHHRAHSRTEINWATLLPPENVTQWLAVDPDCQRIEIEPSAAVPDLA